MRVQEVMERVGTAQTGRAVAYIKDALEEVNMLHETHTRVGQFDIVQDQRNYRLSNDLLKILSITCLNHLNTNDEYRQIPRLLTEPLIRDDS